jgi:hypothetical protein
MNKDQVLVIIGFVVVLERKEGQVLEIVGFVVVPERKEEHVQEIALSRIVVRDQSTDRKEEAIFQRDDESTYKEKDESTFDKVFL